VLIPAFLWLGLTSTLAATRVEFTWLVSLRFLAGLSLGAIPPLVISYLTGLAPPRYRGTYIFWISGASFLAAPATIFLIRWLTPLQPFGVAGWRWPFAVAGVAALCVGGGFLLAPDAPRSSSLVPADSDTIRLKPRFAFFALLSFVAPWASAGFSLVTGPLLLHRGYDLSNTLLYVGLSTFGPTVSTLAASTFIDRIERRTALILSTLLMLFGAVLFFVAASSAWLLTALLVFAVAVGFFVPLLSTYGAEIFPTRRRATAASSAWAISRVASALVPLVMLPLFARSGASAVSSVVYSALILLSGLLAFLGPRGAAGRPVT
jgi:MFS transporter, putative metabolite:H+ symporter